MNNLLIAMLVLGLVQGIAEFLPISSSGHLVLFQNIDFFQKTINTVAKNSEIFIDVSLHIATLIAVLIYLRKEIVTIAQGTITGILDKDFNKSEVRSIRNIIVASIPAGVIGLLFHEFFENVFSSTIIVFYMLIINGFVLISTKFIRLKNRKLDEIGIISAFFVGLFQAFAIIPGISRSGMTISGGLIAGLIPEESARFSFLMAIPVIGGAGLLELMKVLKTGVSLDLILPLSISMVFTVIVALVSLKALFSIVKKVKIDLFGYYTILVGISGVIFYYI